MSYRHIDNSSVISHGIGDQQKKTIKTKTLILPQFKGVIRVQPGQSTEKPSSSAGPALSVHRDTQQEVLGEQNIYLITPFRHFILSKHT